MKDVDLLRPIIMEERNTKRILRQLERDSTFLRDHSIMDYSVLLGIFYLKLEFSSRHDDIKEELDGFSDLPSAHSVSNSMTHMHSVHSSNISRELGGIRARIIDSPGIYYIGIIDTLQEYTWKKRLETWAKTYLKRDDPKGISSVEPVLYQQRFINYMRHVLISQKEYKRTLGLSPIPFSTEKVFVYAAGGDHSKDVVRPTNDRLRHSMISPSGRFAVCPTSMFDENDDADSSRNLLSKEDSSDMEMVQFPFKASLTPATTFGTMGTLNTQDFVSKIDI